MIQTPKISIITPSYNQAMFLEETIRSIHDQNYPNLEHIIIDGGSTDGSVDIIKRYAPKLAYWVSEPDNGQYHALNKGFSKSTGEIMAWLNSDDKYTPWALHVVAELFSLFPEIEWLTTLYRLRWDKRGFAVSCTWQDGFSQKGFLRGENLSGTSWFTKGFIQQESTFWRRSLWERTGARLDDSYRYAGDFELWARFNKFTPLYGVETPLGGFRIHGEQKTSNFFSEYVDEGKAVLKSYGGRPYNGIESLMRCGLARTLPPGRLRSACVKIGLLYPEKICRHLARRGEGWEIVTI